MHPNHNCLDAFDDTHSHSALPFEMNHPYDFNGRFRPLLGFLPTFFVKMLLGVCVSHKKKINSHIILIIGVSYVWFY